MSQQEFEPRKQRPDEEIYQPHYPYNWSGQDQQAGMPRDEPPSTYSAQSGERYDVPGTAQVPWWARPQPQQNGSLTFAAIVAIVIVLTLVMGALGIVGVVLGSLAHILGVILGAIFALLIFVCLLVCLILSLVGRAIGRAVRPSGAFDRRAWRYQRHMARRAARRSWRGW